MWLVLVGLASLRSFLCSSWGRGVHKPTNRKLLTVDPEIKQHKIVSQTGCQWYLQDRSSKIVSVIGQINLKNNLHLSVFLQLQLLESVRTCVVESRFIHSCLASDFEVLGHSLEKEVSLIFKDSRLLRKTVDLIMMEKQQLTHLLQQIKQD